MLPFQWHGGHGPYFVLQDVCIKPSRVLRRWRSAPLRTAPHRTRVKKKVSVNNYWTSGDKRSERERIRHYVLSTKRGGCLTNGLVPCLRLSVFVCMYVCMYVFMYVCMYVYMYVCMYVYMYVCMNVCMYVATYACIYLYTSMNIYILHTVLYVFSIYLRIYLFIYLSISIYFSIYQHTKYISTDSCIYRRHAVAQLVEALRSKPEGLSQWKFPLT